MEDEECSVSEIVYNIAIASFLPVIVMTLLVPLDSSTSSLQGPSFVHHSETPDIHLATILSAIVNAKRIIVLCGAGISVQAGIPDFRSPNGLFKSLKRANSREVLASGKDLFDASIFASEHSISMFCRTIAQLSKLSKAAEPTPFHRLLRTLDDSGRLLRVYTQNIDAIERKSGLSFGVPEYENRRNGKHRLKESSDTDDRASPRIPRCIPLHGTLELLHCQLCNHSVPLDDDHLPSLVQGLPPECPECNMTERTRKLVGKRSRGVGKLRPSVVLYNEAHRDGEVVGEVVRKDLLGTAKAKGRAGADLLLVVGTSLQVPGTKRIAREFAKAVHGRGSLSSSISTELPAIKAVYLNLEFPVPTHEWDGVFDVWLRGDAQYFAELLHHEINKSEAKRSFTTQRKRKIMKLAVDPLDDEQSLQPKSSRSDLKKSKPEHSCGDRHSTDSCSSSTKLYIRIPPRNRPNKLLFFHDR